MLLAGEHFRQQLPGSTSRLRRTLLGGSRNLPKRRPERDMQGVLATRNMAFGSRKRRFLSSGGVP
jgi:hypothetical protein